LAPGGAGFGNNAGRGNANRGNTGGGTAGGGDGAGTRAGGFGARNGAGAFAAASGAGGRFRNGPPPTLWYLDESGQLMMTRVHAGLTDGQKTVVESPRIKEGMQVIIGVNDPASARQATGGPFGGPPGPGGGVQFRRPGF
jgi:hypothetical protein